MAMITPAGAHGIPAWVHPHDLALRDLLLTGGFDAAVRAGVPAHALPNTTASGSADA